MIELNVYEHDTDEYHWDMNVNTLPSIGDELSGCVVVGLRMVGDDDEHYQVWIRY